MIGTLLRAAQQKRGAGYIEAPLPSGTRHVSELIGLGPGGVTPPSASVRSPLVSAKYQSASNACLGFGAAQAFRTTCLHRGIACPDLSGLFPYKLGRASMGLEDTDAGMSFAALTSAIERFGFASEAAWPFSLLRVNSRPTASALHDGYDRRGLRGYYSIANDDVEGVRRANASGYAVLGAFPIDQYFQLDSGDHMIDAPAGLIGFHAMVIEGYHADGSFDILNHYGESWRNSGRCCFTEAYMRQSRGYLVFDVNDWRAK